MLSAPCRLCRACLQEMYSAVRRDGNDDQVGTLPFILTTLKARKLRKIHLCIHACAYLNATFTAWF